MSQRHLPVWPPAWRLDKHFQERLQRGGTSLPVRPRIGAASVVLIVGPVGHGMGWI